MDVDCSSTPPTSGTPPSSPSPTCSRSSSLGFKRKWWTPSSKTSTRSLHTYLRVASFYSSVNWSKAVNLSATWAKIKKTILTAKTKSPHLTLCSSKQNRYPSTCTSSSKAKWVSWIKTACLSLESYRKAQFSVTSVSSWTSPTPSATSSTRTTASPCCFSKLSKETLYLYASNILTQKKSCASSPKKGRWCFTIIRWRYTWSAWRE